MLLVLDHVHALLDLKELFHFVFGHYDSDLFAKYFVKDCRDWVGEDKRDCDCEPKEPRKVSACLNTMSGTDSLGDDLSKDHNQGCRCN